VKERIGSFEGEGSRHKDWRGCWWSGFGSGKRKARWVLGINGAERQ